MPTYTECDTKMNALVDEVRRAFHGPLVDAGVSFNLLFARATGDGMAISANGYPALAQVKIHSLKDRVKGLADASIIFDEIAIKEMTKPEITAIIDHELFHLELLRGKTGAVKEDDAGRPRLRIRLHDWQHGGFFEIVQRHRMDAVEARAVVSVHQKFEQRGLFDGEHNRSEHVRPEGETADPKENGQSFREKVKDFLDDAGVNYRENVEI